MRSLEVDLKRCDSGGQRTANGSSSGDGEEVGDTSGGSDAGDSGIAPEHVLCGLDSDLGMSQPSDDYYRDFRSAREKYVLGDNSATGFDAEDHWYYLLPNGDMYELIPPYDRPGLVGEFVEHVGAKVYEAPSRLHDQADQGGGACP